MGRSEPKRGAATISQQPVDPMLVDFCPDLAEWPHRWRIDDRDIALGRALVEALTPFLLNLLHSDLSRKAMNHHRHHLGMLGGEIVRRVYDEPKLRRLPPEELLHRYIEDEGSPLIYPSITEAQQRSFDATCLKLYRFLGRPGDS